MTATIQVPEPVDAEQTPSHRRVVLWTVFVTVVILTALAFFAVGRLTVAAQQVADDGADAGFARDMQAHHAQAVEMALAVRDTSANEEIRAIAYDIATTQQHQSGQMFAWLQERMEGMATPEQLQALRSASGADADRLFADLMIRHHQGGVAMATAALNLAQTARVRDFAAGLVEAQNAEILALQDLRARL